MKRSIIVNQSIQPFGSCRLAQRTITNFRCVRTKVHNAPYNTKAVLKDKEVTSPSSPSSPSSP
ncbi:hypothetical protein NIES4103_10770 [Nostoc sp. NIES-4103]|nr:hypothetical protein NIES4103_10770 [Nostoc sp. NIES-4103]